MCWPENCSIIGPLKMLLKFIQRRLSSLRVRAVSSNSPQKRRWRLLQVEPAIACNLNCVMCPWREIAKNSKNSGLMGPEVWNAIRPYLSEAASIDFTGGGEPLLQPELPQWIEEAKVAGCETGFLSNGLLLEKSKLQRLLTAGLNWICISMDGADAQMYERIRFGSNFRRVCENVANIAGLRSGKLPKTMINFVLMDLNFHQVEDMVRLTARLGVDQINFKQCDVIRGDGGKGHGLFGSQDTGEIRRLQNKLAKARHLAKKLNIASTAFSFTPEEQPVCDQDPRNSLFIRYDGVVAPCINLSMGGPTTFLGKEVTMPDVHFGCLPQDDLMDLWQSETCQFYRQRFEQRVRRYDAAVLAGLTGSSGAGRLNSLREAQAAMPDPPRGCNVCHYLYDV